MNLELVKAWQFAGAALNVTVLAPYQITLRDQRVVDVEAFLPDFGSPNGIVLVELEDEARTSLIATSLTYYSMVSSAYEAFEAQQFIATLNDWGWFGPPDKAPPWYTGNHWE